MSRGTVELASKAKQRTATLNFMANCRAGTIGDRETEITLIRSGSNRAYYIMVAHKNV
jgi:hypothetical protein